MSASEQHKPGRIKPGRIKRAALSLQHQNGYTFDVCRVQHPGTKQLPIHISGAGFEDNLQIWLLGTTPFDTTPFICLPMNAVELISSPLATAWSAAGEPDVVCECIR